MEWILSLLAVLFLLAAIFAGGLVWLFKFKIKPKYRKGIGPHQKTLSAGGG
jgi:hypothetical protein